MAELLTGKPLFDGKTELEQLNKVLFPHYCSPAYSIM